MPSPVAVSAHRNESALAPLGVRAPKLQSRTDRALHKVDGCASPERNHRQTACTRCGPPAHRRAYDRLSPDDTRPAQLLLEDDPDRALGHPHTEASLHERAEEHLLQPPAPREPLCIELETRECGALARGAPMIESFDAHALLLELSAVDHHCIPMAPRASKPRADVEEARGAKHQLGVCP